MRTGRSKSHEPVSECWTDSGGPAGSNPTGADLATAGLKSETGIVEGAVEISGLKSEIEVVECAGVVSHRTSSCNSP